MTDDTNNTTLPASNVESDSCHAPLGEKEAQGLDTRVNIRVISYRKRKHDPDGVSIKAVLDGLVRANILRNDSTKEIGKITFESCQSDEEKTIIEIDEILEDLKL